MDRQTGVANNVIITRIVSNKKYAHETRHSISLISYAGCLGLSPVYFSEVCVAA